MLAESDIPMMSAQLSGTKVDLSGGAAPPPTFEPKSSGCAAPTVAAHVVNLSAAPACAASPGTHAMAKDGTDWLQMDDDDVDSPKLVVGVWARVSALREKYGRILSKLRPLREFCRFSKPSGDVAQRLVANLAHFQVNYACLVVLVAAAFIVANPKSLVVICILALIWGFLLKKNDDTTWELKVASMRLNRVQLWLLLGAVSAFVLFFVVGNVLTSAAFFCTVLVLAHAGLHPIPESTDIITDVGKVIVDGI